MHAQNDGGTSNCCYIEIYQSLQALLRLYGTRPYGAVLDFDIQQMDDVRTSGVAITFLDDSIVKLTEHSKLVITKYVTTPT